MDGLSPVVVSRLLVAGLLMWASAAVAHRLIAPRLGGLPGPGIKSVSLASAGGFLTTGPQGSPSEILCLFGIHSSQHQTKTQSCLHFAVIQSPH